MEVGIAMPQIFPGAVDVPLIREFVARAEALGYKSAWVLDHTFGTSAALEPVALLTYAAALTERLRLGTAVLLTAVRNPVHLAKSLATLDQLSGGRLMVGVGLGHGTENYSAYGLAPERRIRRFTEGIRLMKRLWTEPRVSFKGDFATLENAAVEPKPVQRPHPPIWFGGHHPDALRRAIEFGDGFMGSGSSSTEQFRKEVQVLRDHLQKMSRNPSDFPVGKRVYLAVDPNRRRAQRRLSAWFVSFYGDLMTREDAANLVEHAAVWGDAEECVGRLAEVMSAGASLLLLNPVFDELKHLEVLASEVVPKLLSG